MYWLTKNNISVLGTFNFYNRSDWEGDIAPYSPRFQDGWSPGIISFFDDDNFDFGLDKNEDFVLSNMSKDRVKNGGGGCIVQRYHTCLSPRRPGFNSRGSQELFT